MRMCVSERTVMTYLIVLVWDLFYCTVKTMYYSSSKFRLNCLIFKPCSSSLFPWADFALEMMSLRNVCYLVHHVKGESNEVCYEVMMCWKEHWELLVTHSVWKTWGMYFISTFIAGLVKAMSLKWFEGSSSKLIFRVKDHGHLVHHFITKRLKGQLLPPCVLPYTAVCVQTGVDRNYDLIEWQRNTTIEYSALDLPGKHM